jgi:hypothetical protein
VTVSGSSVRTISNQHSSAFIPNSLSNVTYANSTNITLIPTSMNQSNATSALSGSNHLVPALTNESNTIGEGNTTGLQTSIHKRSSVGSVTTTNNASGISPSTAVSKNTTLSASSSKDNNNKAGGEIGTSSHLTTLKTKKINPRDQLLNNKLLNISPIAKDDVATTEQKTAVNIAVLKNDKDAVIMIN